MGNVRLGTGTETDMTELTGTGASTGSGTIGLVALDPSSSSIPMSALMNMYKIAQMATLKKRWDKMKVDQGDYTQERKSIGMNLVLITWF